MISKDLFLAILAMDSYNRGYDAGIADGGENDPDGLGDASDGTVQVGSATVSFNLGDVEDGSFEQDAVDSSFYAIAYDIGADGPEDLANQTVISFRGTDSDIDWFEGWTIGAGMVGWNTSKLALDFYTAVTEQPSYRDEATDTIVTGQSPGRRAA